MKKSPHATGLEGAFKEFFELHDNEDTTIYIFSSYSYNLHNWSKRSS